MRGMHLWYCSDETKPACEGGELKLCIKFCSTCYSPVPGEPGPGCTTATIATLGGVSGPWTITVVDNNGVVRSLFHFHSSNTNKQYTCECVCVRVCVSEINLFLACCANSPSVILIFFNSCRVVFSDQLTTEHLIYLCVFYIIRSNMTTTSAYQGLAKYLYFAAMQ